MELQGGSLPPGTYLIFPSAIKWYKKQGRSSSIRCSYMVYPISPVLRQIYDTSIPAIYHVHRITPTTITTIFIRNTVSISFSHLRLPFLPVPNSYLLTHTSCISIPFFFFSNFQDTLVTRPPPHQTNPSFQSTTSTPTPQHQALPPPHRPHPPCTPPIPSKEPITARPTGLGSWKQTQISPKYGFMQQNVTPPPHGLHLSKSQVIHKSLWMIPRRGCA